MSLTTTDETVVPALPCVSLDETLDFYRTLGFEVTYQQKRPYVYGAVRRGGIELHFGAAPKGLDPKQESTGCLVMVTEVAPYHVVFTDALRAKYGKVPASGIPRLTRFRTGQSRFTVVDLSGNVVIYIQRGEPEHLEYGGSKQLSGLAKALDNARIFREFKNDDNAAAKILDVALVRFRSDAPVVDYVRALAARAELAIALGDVERAQTIRNELESIDLSDEDRERFSHELSAADDLEGWLNEQDKSFSSPARKWPRALR
jgi:hypothetical protein